VAKVAKAAGQSAALALVITAILMFLFIMAKVPFGGAYKIDYETLGVFKWIWTSLFGLFCFFKMVDAAYKKL
jgi:hypothetical protein